MLLLAAFLLATSVALAHSVGLSRGQYRLSPDGALAATLLFARPEVSDLVPGLDANLDASIDPSELDAAKPALYAAIVGRTRVIAGGTPCPGRLESAGLVEGDGLSLGARWTCPPGSPATVTLDFLQELTPGHRHLAQAVATSAGTVAIAYRENPSFDVPVAPPEREPPMRALGRALALTAEPLVLLALLRAGASRRELGGVLAAFLGAQALAIAVCALAPLAPAARIALPAAALTLAYLGVENAVAPGLSGRWKIAIPIGLVQGLALAAASAPAWTPALELPLAAALTLVLARARASATASLALSALALAAGSWLFFRALH
jgi:hypothetical protein